MKTLPHYKVFVRLAPSSIHGIGVFAIIEIPKGTSVFWGDEKTKTIKVSKFEVTNLPFNINRLYEDFCVLDGDYYICPINFNFLTPSWYLNESSAPNVECKDNLLFYTLRDIKQGEELTVDYSTYSDN